LKYMWKMTYVSIMKLYSKVSKNCHPQVKPKCWLVSVRQQNSGIVLGRDWVSANHRRIYPAVICFGIVQRDQWIGLGRSLKCLAK
jgi:hypothetical protein